MRDSNDLAQAIQQRLARVLEAEVSVRDVEPVTAGASKSIWTFVATINGEDRDLVLRRDPIENQRPENMAQEAAVIRAAGEAGVPVPAIIDSGDGDAGLGAPFVIMSREYGETLAPRNLRDPEVQRNRDLLAEDLGRAIAQIQKIPFDCSPSIKYHDDVAQFEEDYRAGGLLPAMEIGWRWLRENPTPRRERVFVHGDFRHGNLMFNHGRLAAVLDWELPHIGDPLEDMGWVSTKAWRFGYPEVVGGFGSISSLLDGYESVAGWRPEDREVQWWSVFGSIRWGTMCRRQAARTLVGEEDSLELALIGRRVAENEFDVLVGLGLAVPGERDLPTETRDGGMFEWPTIDEILQRIISTTGRSKVYSDRLIRSAVSVVARELNSGPILQQRLADALAAAGYASEDELAIAIRDGAELTDALITAVRTGVESRLLVWNPKYLAYPAPPER
ncbi:phosphotransferase [Cumulibacter soli]|uniref:phosphotransferase n=1 Tax=Cumulibacter soli TaxID=2546344 RepID=UPI0010682718|nr:phosphotransferase [Cumulibacter soli]